MPMCSPCLHHLVPPWAPFCPLRHTQRLSWMITCGYISSLLAQSQGPLSQCAEPYILPLRRRLSVGHASQLLWLLGTFLLLSLGFHRLETGDWVPGSGHLTKFRKWPRYCFQSHCCVMALTSLRGHSCSLKFPKPPSLGGGNSPCTDNTSIAAQILHPYPPPPRQRSDLYPWPVSQLLI